MTYDHQKAVSRINQKKALVSITRKKLFRPVYKGRLKAFTGYQTLATFKTDAVEYLTLEMTLKKGEAILGVVQGDTFHTLCEGTCQKEIELPVQKGFARLRIIGSNADLTYTLKRRQI